MLICCVHLFWRAGRSSIMHEVLKAKTFQTMVPVHVRCRIQKKEKNTNKGIYPDYKCFDSNAATEKAVYLYD